MQNSIAPYTPRNPRISDYYRCVEDYFEELERVHEDRYQSRLGYLRPEIRFTIFRFLDCGCLQNGFARVRCDDCGHEYLVAFSCKRRHFCPSCHQKRVIEFGEWFLDDLAVTVPHRHIVQTFGDFLGFNPHCHIIISDGTFDKQGNFHITPYYDAHALEQLFRHKLLKMLLKKGAISQPVNWISALTKLFPAKNRSKLFLTY